MDITVSQSGYSTMYYKMQQSFLHDLINPTNPSPPALSPLLKFYHLYNIFAVI